MVYAINGRLGIDFAATSTTLDNILGRQEEGSDGNVYEYVKAGSAITAFQAVGILENGSATPLTTTTAGAVPQSVGVAQVAIASASYGWVIRKGMLFSVLGAASCLLDVKLYTTAVAGVVDDAVTTQIFGLRLNETLTGAATASASASTPMSVNS